MQPIGWQLNGFIEREISGAFILQLNEFIDNHTRSSALHLQLNALTEGEASSAFTFAVKLLD